MSTQKPVLTIIYSTHSSLAGLEQSGLLDRHKRLLEEYQKHFHVVLYSSDSTDYSSYFNVTHHHLSSRSSLWGLRHAGFYLWLIFQAVHMRGVIKVFGSNIPTLPLVKILSRCPMMVTYQYNYADLAELTYGRGVRSWLARGMEYLALKPADVVAVTTPVLEAKVKNVYHKSTVLLPNWFDKSVINQTGTTIERDSRLILYAGRLDKIKGVDVLIQAFARARNDYPDLKLVICGVGEEREWLEELADKLGVQPDFRGRLDNSDVLHLMTQTAIFVLPTLTSEGHPKALLEAMACGAVCIVSDVPGNRELISQARNGILVPIRRDDMLSKAICHLLSDNNLRKRLGNQAKADVEIYEFFSIVMQEIQTLLSWAKGF
jgi:glycosyltransferase involved in cell wall biosynthesis